MEWIVHNIESNELKNQQKVKKKKQKIRKKEEKSEASESPCVSYLLLFHLKIKKWRKKNVERHTSSHTQKQPDDRTKSLLYHLLPTKMCVKLKTLVWLVRWLARLAPHRAHRNKAKTEATGAHSAHAMDTSNIHTANRRRTIWRWRRIILYYIL